MFNDRPNGYGQTVSKKTYDVLASKNFSNYDNKPEVLTIEGRSVDECRQKLYSQYGTGFKILSKKQDLKGGFLGFGQKEIWIVDYVVEQKPALSQAEDFQQKQDELLKVVTNSNATLSTKQIAAVDKKLEELTKNMNAKFEQMLIATNAQEKHPSIQKVEDLLQDNEFTFEYINEITTRLKAELSYEELDDFAFVQKTVVDWIGQSLKISPDGPHKCPHVIILVGPTGVGKTTTIAKLAGTMLKKAKSEDKPKPSIRMVTIDRTRVGAEEQLRRYGNIMLVEVDKAESAEDVKTIFETYKANLDILFIDTPGYSPNDFENIAKMRSMLEVQGVHPDIYLTIAASAKARDLESIIQNYEVFNFSSIIITKWDETTRIGNVLSVLHKKNKAVSYITDGQQVPRAIERASVVKFLLNLHDFDIERSHIDELFPEDK